jgi:Icc protein
MKLKIIRDMKRLLILLVFLGIFTAGCRQLKQGGNEDSIKEFSFAFLTDIHLQPELGAVDGFQKAIDTLNILDPDFIITGGDLVMDVLDQTYGRADSLYSLYQEMSKGFNMPVYNTVGNHEVYGWHRNEEGIEDHPEFGKKMFENRLGDRYYSFDHKGWHFIVLDALARHPSGYYMGKIDKEQIDWLKTDLQNVEKETPIVISVHLPFVTTWAQIGQGSLTANPENAVTTNSLEVLQLFKEYNLKLVLQGHLHFLEDIFVGNKIHFITAGAVCGYLWRERPDTFPEEGFLLIHVSGNEFDWEYVDYGWTPLVKNS